MKMIKTMVGLSLIAAACGAQAFEYTVRQPSDKLRPTFQAKDTQPGVWSLNHEDVLAKAKAAGKITVLLNTASWWCPYCETLEELVLSSPAWDAFVSDSGCYLSMLDFPYRGAVTKDQEWKSYYPELGKGWGFKCWLMNPDYLAEEGLTKNQGLDAIMHLYEIQKSLATESAALQVISNWQQTAEFSYGKVGYPTLIVFGSDGKEMGRMGFPWYSTEGVTASEAQEYVLQGLERIITGDCAICDDPLAGNPPLDCAQTYDGWLTAEKEGIAGTIQFKTSKMSTRGIVKVSGSMTIAGKKTTFKQVSVNLSGECAACGDYGDSLGTVKLTKGDWTAVVTFGEVGLVGHVTDGVTDYAIGGGGRNVFAAKDNAAKDRAAKAPSRIWNVILTPTEKRLEPAIVRGYSTLSVSLGSKGKVKVSGRMGDGAKVNLTTQLIVGDEGSACLPIYVPLYSKNGSVGFVLWFQNGRLLSATDVSSWKRTGTVTFDVSYSPTFTMSSGYGTVQNELELVISGMDEKTVVKGLPLAENPAEDWVVVSGKKWQGEEFGFTARCDSKTGVLTGSQTLLTVKADGKTKKVKATFYGVVMGGSGYGTLVVTNDASWPVKIAICGSCSD